MKALRGFALPTAIFLLTVMALLGSFMVSLASSQAITSAEDVQGARAYRAARAGLERALFSLQTASNATVPGFTGPTVVGQNNVFGLTLTVDGFNVVINCTTPTTPHNEGGVSKYIFWVDSTASSGGAIGGFGYVERVVNTFIEF